MHISSGIGISFIGMVPHERNPTDFDYLGMGDGV